MTKIKALACPPRTQASSYPAEFAKRMEGREKRALGDYFGIKKFGVNLTRLQPGAESALLHRHTLQEEFVYVLEGEVTLVTETEETLLTSGDCAGFTPEIGAHKLVNKSDKEALYLEIGDRVLGDQVTYPVDDIQGVLGADGRWQFHRKDGTLY